MAQHSDSDTSNATYVPAQAKDIAEVLSIGLATGALTAIIGELLQRFFINPVFCHGATGGNYCGPDGLTGFYIATVLVTLLSIVTLARLNIFRPLLIAVGAAIALWGIKGPLAALGVVEYGFWTAVLFGLTYVLLYWLLRARHFGVSLALVIVAIVALRLLRLL